MQYALIVLGRRLHKQTYLVFERYTHRFKTRNFYCCNSIIRAYNFICHNFY